MVIGVAAASAGVAIAFGTYSAAGADASGYLSQAGMWAKGQLRLTDELSVLSGWPLDAGTSAPLGWHAAAERGWQVPTYGPGLPMLMAFPYRIGGPIAACLVVAASAAIAVLAASAIAFRVAGAPAAMIAAVAFATAPVFLYQAIQPMSDVPVTAAWMVCWALLIRSPAFARVSSNELPPSPRLWRTAVALAEAGRRGHAEGAFGLAGVSLFSVAGVACAMAILIRPNLAPLAIVPLAFVWRNAGSHRRMAASFSFALPVVLAGIGLAWLQWRWYGSPIRSGYGTVEQLYSLANIGPNATRFVGWLASTSPLLAIALVAAGSIGRSPVTWSLALFALLNLGAYLVYFVFEEWWYLRFLLPAVAIAAVFCGVTIATLLDRVPAAARAVLLFAAALVIGGAGLGRARSLDVFQLTAAQRRVLQIDRYLDSALRDRAVIIAGEQSGAARFDTGHAIVRWEATSRDDLVRVLTVLEADRRDMWILLDAWEEPLVRAKYAGVEAVSLDWPPSVDAGDAHRTRAWRLADRGRYLAGERIITDRLR